MSSQYVPFEVYVSGSQHSCGQIRVWSKDGTPFGGMFGLTFDTTTTADFYMLKECKTVSDVLGPPIFHEDKDGVLTVHCGAYEMFTLSPAITRPRYSNKVSCPLCGHEGDFRKTALVCPVHDIVIGGF